MHARATPRTRPSNSIFIVCYVTLRSQDASRMQPGVRNGAYKVQGVADNLVPVLIRVVMTPFEIIFPFPASRFRELTISLVVFFYVLVVHLVFILVPLVVVTSVSIVVPLAPVIRVGVVSSRRNRASQ